MYINIYTKKEYLTQYLLPLVFFYFINFAIFFCFIFAPTDVPLKGKRQKNKSKTAEAQKKTTRTRKPLKLV